MLFFLPRIVVTSGILAYLTKTRTFSFTKKVSFILKHDWFGSTFATVLWQGTQSFQRNRTKKSIPPQKRTATSCEGRCKRFNQCPWILIPASDKRSPSLAPKNYWGRHAQGLHGGKGLVPRFTGGKGLVLTNKSLFIQGIFVKEPWDVATSIFSSAQKTAYLPQTGVKITTIFCYLEYLENNHMENHPRVLQPIFHLEDTHPFCWKTPCTTRNV